MGQENTQTGTNPQNSPDRYEPQRSQSESGDRRFGEGMEAGDGLDQNDTREFDNIENQSSEDEQSGDENRNNEEDTARPGEDGVFARRDQEAQPRNREGLL